MDDTTTPSGAGTLHAGTDGLSAREVELARLITSLVDPSDDDHDDYEALDRLIHALVDVLPAAEAGVLLLDHECRPGLVASTDDSSKHLELYQLQRHDGPCVEAVESGERIVDDLGLTDRWPQFTSAALALGFRSVLAVPMRSHGTVVGGVNIFFRSGAVTEASIRTAQVLVDAGAVAITARRRLEQATSEAEQLTRALRTRVLIEQAKGVLAEHAGTSVEEAFGVLRGFARARRIKLVAAAEAVAKREVPPAAVVAAASRYRR